jgi:hypothetical protein
LSFGQFDLLRDVEFLCAIAWGVGAESRWRAVAPFFTIKLSSLYRTLAIVDHARAVLSYACDGDQR